MNNDYEEAAEFVPYRKMPKVSKEEAVKWQMLQRELLFRDLDVTLDDMECTCEYELKDDELERVQSRLKQNRPIEADIEKMVLVKYSFTVSYQGQSGSDEKLALAYSFGDGNWYTMGSRPAIVRAAILSDCEQ